MRALSWTVLLWHLATIPLVASRKPNLSSYSYSKYERTKIRGLGRERSFRSFRRLQMEENEEKCSMGMSTCPPSQAPSVSFAPSSAPSPVPSSAPTISQMPTASLVPSAVPTQSPAPSSAPSPQPSSQPSSQPSAAPSSMPSIAPSAEPTISNPPTGEPSSAPSAAPSSMPTPVPSASPSEIPSLTPSLVPSALPSMAPSRVPSQEPSVSFIPTISSQPSMAPTSSAMPTTSAAPSNIPSLQPSMAPSESPEPSTTPTEAPSQIPSVDPFAFDTTVVAGDDGSSYISTCRSSIPDNATGLQEQILLFGYSLYLEPGSDVTFEVNGVELRLQREVANEFLTCDFSRAQDFYTHNINSLPKDAADTNKTCSGVEMLENANCFKVNAGFAATIFYIPDDSSGRRRLQSDTITDANVAEAFSTFLGLVFQSGELGSPKVVGMTFESFVNTLPPTLAPTLPPGERGSTSPTPGAITGYAVAAGAGIVLLIAGVLWIRSREEKGETDRGTSRVEYSQHQEVESDFPEERTEDLATHLTSQYPTSDADEPTDDQGFARSTGKEEPRKAYVLGEDEYLFDDDFAQVLKTNMGTEEVQDPIFVPTGTSPARSHVSSQSMNSGETPIDFDPTMIPRDYDIDDTVEL